MDIGDNVRIEAVGYLEDGRKFLDTRKAGRPLEFTLGAHTVFPAFEQALLDLQPHDKRTIRIHAANAYGEHDADLIEKIPKADFPDWEHLPVGQYIEFESENGPIRCKVSEPEEDYVVLDHNHELAGYDLFYDIEVLDPGHESAVEHEKHPHGCACGCDRLKESLAS